MRGVDISKFDKKDVRLAKRLADRYFEKQDEEDAAYYDIEIRGGFPREYGKRTRSEVLRDVLLPTIKKLRKG